MSENILYTFRRCPYAMRARLAIHLSHFPHQQVEVDLKNKPAEMLRISPKGTVPVLQLFDGTVIDESLEIMRCVLCHHDVQVTMPGEGWELIAENDSTFKHALDRYKYPNRYLDEQVDPLEQRERGGVFLEKLENKLHAQPFLCGQTSTVADYAIFPFVRQFRNVDEAWFENEAPYPKLKKWLQEWISSDIFGVIMEKSSH